MQPEFVVVKDHKFLRVDLILQLTFHYCLFHQGAFDTFLFFWRIMNCVLWAVIKNFLDSFQNCQMTFLKLLCLIVIVDIPFIFNLHYEWVCFTIAKGEEYDAVNLREDAFDDLSVKVRSV